MKAVNLLPPELRTTVATKSSPARAAGSDAKGGAGPFVVLGVLAALVAGTAGSVLTNNQIADKQAELAAATQDSAVVQAQAAKLKPYADFDAVTKTRIATVTDLAGRRFDWEQAMRDLSRAIPAEVTLSSLSGDLGGGTGASSGNALRSAISAPAIDLQGCTDSQKGVATLMSRLNDVDGVTRVSLSKSAKGGAATASGGEAPCGKGDKPSFDIVIFFEGDADKSSVTAAAATGTAATGTAATGTAAATATPAAGATAAATATPASTTTTTTASTGGTTP